jgi:hypothetical protein
MDADEHGVLRDREILFDEIGPLLDREAVGGERMFRGVRRRAAVKSL